MKQMQLAYRLILLLKIINIAIENLNKELYRYCSVHACISYPESTLQTLKNALAITIQLEQVSIVT